MDGFKAPRGRPDPENNRFSAISRAPPQTLPSPEPPLSPTLSDMGEVHFIVQHRSPKTGAWEEKRSKDAPSDLHDSLTHFSGLVIKPEVL